MYRLKGAGVGGKPLFDSARSSHTDLNTEPNKADCPVGVYFVNSSAEPAGTSCPLKTYVILHT